MDPLQIALLAGLAPLAWLTAVIGRWVVRRRFRRIWRVARPWQPATLTRWAERGWLPPEDLERLPVELSPSGVFLEWAWSDPEGAAGIRLREPLRPDTPFEAVLLDAWQSLPAPERESSLTRLREALREGRTWWGGAEKGWNRRPIALPTGELTQREHTLPCLEMTDLTAAPDSAPLDCRRMADEAEGPDLVLALTVIRHQRPRFSHPLAANTGATHSLVQGLSSRIGADVGRRIGGSLGAALGPIGTMVGQYVGEMAGTLGAKTLTRQSLPGEVESVLKGVELRLHELGSLRESPGYERACDEPAQAILRAGQGLDLLRDARKRRLRERFWPTTGLLVLEEAMWALLAELKIYRTAGQVLLRVSRKVHAVVAGGILVQNPWLVRTLPDGPERLSQARRALNQANSTLRSLARQEASGTVRGS